MQWVVSTLHTTSEHGVSSIIALSKRDGTRAETRFGLSAKRTSPFKSAGVSVQSTAGSRGVRISGQQLYRPCSDVQCKAAGYPLHSHLSPSLPLPCVTVCHQVPNALYYRRCAHLGCRQPTELTPPGRFKFRAKDEIYFLGVCHHISTGLCLLLCHHISTGLCLLLLSDFNET